METRRESQHTAAELRRCFDDGLLSPEMVSLLLDYHLAQVCPTCRERLQCRIEALGSGNAGGDDPELDELLQLDPKGQRTLVQKARTRFRSAALARRFLALAQEATPDDPTEAALLAEIAELIAHRADAPFEEVLTVAVRGNALRAQGRLKAAEAELNRARQMALLEPGNRRLHAELDSFEGSLRKDQRRFHEAERLLARARDGFQALKHREGEARVLVQLAVLLRRQGRPELAVIQLKSAMPLLEPDRNLRLCLIAHHNLAACLHDAGDAERADVIVHLIRPVYSLFGDRLSLVRLQWLEGQIAGSLGFPERAQNLLEGAIRNLLECGYPVLAAVAALDLTELHLRHERHQDLIRLASLLPPIFRSERIEPEEAACVALLHRTLVRQSGSIELLEQLRLRLQNRTLAKRSA